MSQTISQIINECVQQALGLDPETDGLQTEIRNVALNIANHKGKMMWDSWPWDNSKLDEFTAPTAVDGVITFAANVDIIRAIRTVNTSQNSATPVFNEDEVVAARIGSVSPSDTYQHLSDSSDGYRRIKIDTTIATDASQTIKVLALKRWVDFTVDAAYSASAPTATPYDYRVATFPLDKAVPALKEFVIDGLKVWDGQAPGGGGSSALKIAIDREIQLQERERRIIPSTEYFSEVGAWW